MPIHSLCARGPHCPSRQPAAVPSAKPAGTLLRDAARVWVALASVYYALDLLRQFRDGFADATGRAFGEDFINYWSGAFLALHHRAFDIYNYPVYHAFQQTVVGPGVGPYHYSYSPVLPLLSAPFALVPYVPALGAWLAASWLAFLAALRAAAAGRGALLLGLAAPAVFINAWSGQNGAWSAALIGGGLVLLDRRPVAAGILFGLQIYKPQLGLLLPIALAAGGHWRALLAAAATAMTLLIASVAAFGIVTWGDYLRVLAILREIVLEDGASVWHRMVSVFVLARRLGADVPLAYLVQALVGAAAAGVVALGWFRNSSPAGRNAALVAGSFLATPYLQDYDLVAGAIVAAWLTGPEVPDRLRPAGRAAALMMLLAVFAGFLAKLTGLQLGPLLFAPSFIVSSAMMLAPNASAVSRRPAPP
ncbi:MAG: DUF2029 domain-containing protein [Acetobacteraceae bacterium]|nr:DUF2029 domain-containing protein [Acetobacteraceae bacterium]